MTRKPTRDVVERARAAIKDRGGIGYEQLLLNYIDSLTENHVTIVINGESFSIPVEVSDLLDGFKAEPDEKELREVLAKECAKHGVQFSAQPSAQERECPLPEWSWARIALAAMKEVSRRPVVDDAAVERFRRECARQDDVEDDETDARSRAKGFTWLEGYYDLKAALNAAFRTEGK